jgi:hypothetical protein
MSEEWLRRVRRALGLGAVLGSAVDPLLALLCHPLQLATMLFCMFVSESWNWQFRPPSPPTRLLRQTWALRR